MNLFEHSQKLFEKSIPTVPVVDKRPVIKDWVNAESSDLDKPGQWQSANGLGLLMGKRSGIICLDIDIKKGNDRLSSVLKELHGLLPPIYCGILGNPEKPPARLYRFEGEESEKFRFIDVEILSTGNQKVIPPSFNPVSKSQYKWVGKSLLDVDVDELPELSVEVVEFLRLKNDEFRFSDKGGAVALTKGKGRCAHGSHNLISSYAVKLFYQGWDFSDLVDAVVEFDQKINFDSDSIYFLCPSRKEWQSDHPRVNAMFFVSQIYCRNIYRRISDTKYFKEEIKNGFSLEDPETGRVNRQYYSLYYFLKHKHEPCYIPDRKGFMIWDKNHWTYKPTDFALRFAQEYFKKPSIVAHNQRTTFMELCKAKSLGEVQDFLLRDTGKVNFKNGTLELETWKFKKHNRGDKFTHVIDCEFTSGGETPIWDELLSLICMNRPHMVKAIEEFIGYAISAASYDKFNKLLILDGAGSNGKSTLIRVIQGLIGYENTASVSLTDITKNRFSGFSLVNKLINFCSEEPRSAFSQTGIIKKITGGDSIMVEEKNKGAFQYNNLAKLIISYNKMPFFPDDSPGMKRRIVLIPCEQNFEKNPDLKLYKPESRILENEKGKVVIKCLKAYMDAFRRSEFTPVNEGAKRVEEMIMESNSVKSFVKEEIKITKQFDDYVTIPELWEAYKDYQGGRVETTKRRFMKRFMDEFLGESDVTRGLIRSGNVVAKCVRGIQRDK